MNNRFFLQQNNISAYWAGFIMADGNISDQGRLEITIHIRDINHLKRFCLDVEHDENKIAIKNTIPNKKCSIRIRNEFLLNDFKNWGIIPRKTYNWKEPNLQNEFLSDYLRGWFDGDGSFHFSNKNKLKITGNKNAILWYRQKICELGYNDKIYIHNLKEDKIWCNLEIYSKKSIIKFANLIDGEIKLKRKWDQYYNWNIK